MAIINLKGFADAVIAVSFDATSLDASDIQEIAVNHGLLEAHTFTKPCGNDCLCELETGFPATCLRKTYVD